MATSQLPSLCDTTDESTESIRATLGTIHDTAQHLRADADGDLLAFYAELMCYCTLIGDHLVQIGRVGTRPSYELIESIRERLGKVLPSDTSVEVKRRKLEVGWVRVQVKVSPTQAELMRSVLAFSKQQDHRMEFIDFLKSWENKVGSQCPEDEPLPISESFAPQKIGEPSFAVGVAAQDTFKALVSCKSCECLPAHDFGARLGLGTYCSPKGNSDGEEETYFDMFLSAKEHWQEARIHTAKEVVVQFASEGSGLSEQVKASGVGFMRVRRLCEPIDKIQRTMPAYRLELKVMRGRLFKLESKRNNRQADLSQSPITLEEFLQDRPCVFTEKTKKILSVLLGYTVLHLQGTPWLQSTWNSSTILFLRTKASEIPIRPFLQTHLTKICDDFLEPTKQDGTQQDKNPYESDDELEHDFDPDDIHTHPFPTILSLAFVLMEIHFMMPFADLARRFQVATMADTSAMTRFIYALEVFDVCKNDMPGYIRRAINSCLDIETWQDDNGEALGTQDLRRRMYEKVVEPLETDLTLAFSYLSIEGLDQVAQALDLGNWTQPLRHQSAQARDLFTQSDSSIGASSPSIDPRTSVGEIAAPSRSSHTLPPWRAGSGHHLSIHQTNHHFLKAPRDSLSLPKGQYQELDYAAPKFFDDETPTGGHSDRSHNDYSDWRSGFQEAYKKFVPEDVPILLPVKIAVLDTGIDLNHPDIQARAENIKARHNWLHSGASETVYDSDGHGTFVTGLLLDYAQDANIFVAKIADKKPTSPRIIAEAINYAVDVWKVDMISMSFGFPACTIDGYSDLEEAIKRAYSKDVLLFAAASNSGGRLGRAYPARDANVICVNSADAYGNRSAFSPTAIPEDISLATIGEAVESAWPVHLGCEDERAACFKVKSGTSYATPIMTGIAAFLLTYVRLNLPEKAQRLQIRSRMIKLLRRIAEKDGGGIRDGYHFVDISLYGSSLFGKDQTYIKRTIGDILDG